MPDHDLPVEPQEPASDARQKLVDALVNAKCRPPRRGAPASADWRTKLAIPMARIMLEYPDETLASITRDLQEVLRRDHQEGQSKWSPPSERALINWLSDVKNGKQLQGRKPLK